MPTSPARRDERVGVTHQLALAEVGAQQALLHGVLNAVLGGEMDQAVGVERRAGPREVEPEVEAFAGRRLGHLVLHLARPVDGDPVLLGQAGGALALALVGCGGIELEATPGHPHFVAVLELSERGLEPALPDVAPGAGDVGPDLDLHQFQGSSPRCSQ